MEKIKIVIADDHTILLDGLQAILGKQKDIEITGTYTDGQALFDDLQKSKPNVALVDINMPGMNGMELTRKLKEFYPDINVIALSMFDDSGNIMDMIEAGVSGYLLKNVNDTDLVDAIKTVNSGKIYLSPEVSEKITSIVVAQQRKLSEPTQPKLTERELEILKLVADEKSNAEIAGMLCISERTVETHRKNMLRKTGNKTIVGLLKYAFEKQLI